MKKNMIFLIAIILAIMSIPQFTDAQEKDILYNVTQSSEALLFYETYFANPSEELLKKYETYLSNNLHQQNELKNIIDQGKSLKLSEKGEFEKEEEYNKRKENYNKSLEKIKDATSLLEKFRYNEKMLNNEISIVKAYISKLAPPKIYKDKLSSISQYNSEEESFILEFIGNKYWIQMPITYAPEFKSKYLDIEILKFPDGFPKLVFKGHVYNLYDEDKRSNSFISDDGKTYSWVRIGKQIWMAENMKNYAGSGSWEYDNDSSNVATYGRLYNWKTAKTICPTGWHLPTYAEFNQLEKYIDNDKVDDSDCGKHLKATLGWIDRRNGTDGYGFSALPGGDRRTNGDFKYLGSRSFWWSASTSGSEAYFFYIDYSNILKHEHNSKDYGFSVRCLRD